MGKTVGELEDSLGSDEFTKWKAYSQIEPFGHERQNYDVSVVAATIANYSGKLKAGKSLEDFMYVHPAIRKQRETVRTLEAMKAMARKKDG